MPMKDTRYFAWSVLCKGISQGRRLCEICQSGCAGCNLHSSFELILSFIPHMLIYTHLTSKLNIDKCDDGLHTINNGITSVAIYDISMEWSDYSAQHGNIWHTISSQLWKLKWIYIAMLFACNLHVICMLFACYLHVIANSKRGSSGVRCPGYVPSWFYLKLYVSM